VGDFPTGTSPRKILWERVPPFAGFDSHDIGISIEMSSCSTNERQAMNAENGTTVNF